MGDQWSRERFSWPARLADPELSDRARHVGLVLYSYAHNETGECWPSFDTLAKLTGKSLDTVRRGLNELKAAGFIQIKRGCGRGNQSHFVLKLPSEKGGTVAILNRERVATVPLKGSKSANPYKDELTQGTEAYARQPSDADPWHRGHLQQIEPGSSHDQAWCVWLAQLGLGSWEGLQLIGQDGRITVPLTFPPDPSHPVEPALARGWFERRTAMIRDERRRSA